MFTSTLAAAVLASTLVSPLPTAEAGGSTLEYVPLVRENVGLSYTLNVDQHCPGHAIYVHKDVYKGALPEHVTFSYRGTNPLGTSDKATAIKGSVFNWFNASNPYVSLDLVCTSDPHEAINAR
ncbi:hypothetical protein [Agromyces aerolatus]|uniref:hypothetical protein n=1 Tax=Agromyces sp. LY-1074 TaxID=3074080 RepID=UPI0028651791|nr:MULTISPECIES: hypothetical protein [unclassified Agromyces]MDR5701156.1 hypothetical protein [Agromyces sp. LY-1074]MDR5707796.1 hypothetical protein [Agromyces sp. LY-1358]